MRMPWRSPSDLRAPQGDPKTDPPGRGAKKDKSTREWDRQPPPSCDWRLIIIIVIIVIIVIIAIIAIIVIIVIIVIIIMT